MGGYFKMIEQKALKAELENSVAECHCCDLPRVWLSLAKRMPKAVVNGAIFGMITSLWEYLNIRSNVLCGIPK